MNICCDEFREKALKMPRPGDHATFYFYDDVTKGVHFFNTNEFISLSLKGKDKIDYCPFCKKKFWVA